MPEKKSENRKRSRTKPKRNGLQNRTAANNWGSRDGMKQKINKTTINAVIQPENGIEEAICGHPDFVEGCSYGKPRKGHPEGKVLYHIAEVLANVEKYYSDDPDRSALRLIAIVHDTFKHKVDRTKPKKGANHHGWIASRFVAEYSQDIRVLMVTEHHDDAYNAWGQGSRKNKWFTAEERANALIQALLIEGGLGLYLKFYKCDNQTGDKEQDNYDWFIGLIK